MSKFQVFSRKGEAPSYFPEPPISEEPGELKRRSYQSLLNLFPDSFQESEEDRSERNFQFSPLESQDAPVSILEYLSSFPHETGPDLFFLGLEARRKYIEGGQKIYLHCAYTLLCLALYEIEISPELKGPIKPWRYFELSFLYRENFSEFLKKLRNISMIESLGSTKTRDFIEYRDEILIDAERLFGLCIDLTKFPHYDSWINEGILLHFKEDTKDYEYAFQESKFDENIIDEFEISSFKNLPDLDFVDLSGEIEMTWISDSKTLSQEGLLVNNRTLNREDPQSRGFLTENFRYKRTIVNVSPANCRDTFVCDRNTLYTQRVLSYYLIQILDKLENSAMTSNPELSIKRRRRFQQTSSQYIMLDFKKCGLTIPHRVINILSEVLCEKYPAKKDIFKLLKGYSNAVVDICGKECKLLRGTGLGNGNEICSLVVCLAALMLKDEASALVYNDDSVWRIDAGPEKGPASKILRIFDGLGFPINFRKSFISNYNVFCEEYFCTSTEKNWKKEQLSVFPIASMFLQRTIFACKRVMTNINDSYLGSGRSIEIYARLAEKIYGYEIHRFESILPTTLGGWRYYKTSTFDNVADVVFDPEVSRVESGLMNFVRQFVRYINRSGSESLSEFFFSGITYNNSVEGGYSYPDKGYEVCDPWSEKTIEEEYSVRGVSSFRREELRTLNTRGLKNARPNLKKGVEDKTRFSRKRYLELFLRLRGGIPSHLLCVGEVEALLSKLMKERKDVHFRIPKYAYKVGGPRSLVVERKSRSIFIKANSKFEKKSHSEVLQSQLYACSNTRIIKGLDIFFFRRTFISRENFLFRSNKPIRIPSNRHIMDLCEDLRRYGSNIFAAIIDLYTEYDSPVIFPERSRRRKVNRLISPLEYAFGDIPNIVKKIYVTFDKRRRNLVRDYIIRYGVEDRNHLSLFVKEIENLDLPPDEEAEKVYYIPRIQRSNKFLDVWFGEPTLDDLIDEYNEDHKNLSDDESSSRSSSGEDDSPSENKSEYGDYSDESDESIFIEDNPESDDELENLGVREIRLAIRASRKKDQG